MIDRKLACGGRNEKASFYLLDLYSCIFTKHILEVCVCPHALNGIRFAPNRVNELLKSLEVLLVRILALDLSAVSQL